MATRPIGEVIIAEADYQRGDLFKEIDHDRVANAIRYLSFAKLYHPDKYHEFLKVVALHRATWSTEDANFITALYEFEARFQEFLASHPEVTQEVNRVSPKQMVDRVDVELVEKARARRDAARKTAERAVRSATNKDVLKLNETEKETLVQAVEQTIRSAVSEAQSIKELQQLIEKRASSVLVHESADKGPAAQQSIHDTIKTSFVETIKEDPTVMQQLLFGDRGSSEMILDRTLLSALPNKRALHTIITELPMGPNETREGFLDRAESVAKMTMVLSSDLSQAPIARVEPAALLSAIFEARGDRVVTALFKKLPERAKNAVALTTVAKAWEDTVDVITKRAGGALANSLDPIIREANQQSMSGSAKHAASLVGDVLNPLLGRTFTNIVELEALNRSLPPGEQLFPDKHSVATFIQSLDAARQAEGAASAALFLTVTTHYPGVQFVEQHSDNPLTPVVTIVQFAKDSVAWKIVDRAAKSEVVGGFFGKILRPVLGFFGIKVGGAAAGAVAGKATGAAAGRGFSALIGSLLGGTVAPVVGHIIGFVVGFFVMPLIQKVGGWIKNLVTGRVGQLGAVIGAIEQAAGAWSGERAPSAPKQWYEQDWVLIAIIIAVAVLIPMFGAMMQISTQSAALVTSFEASKLGNSGGPYEEIFPQYGGPFPTASTVDSCPVTSGRITQGTYEGKSHGTVCAYDFGSSFGSPVYATHDGCVAAMRSDVPNNTFVKKSFGNYVRLAGTNPDGTHYFTTYAHFMSGSNLQIGQCVSSGDIIGYVDTTGFTFDAEGNLGGGTHLHYQYDGEGCIELPVGCGAR